MKLFLEHMKNQKKLYNYSLEDMEDFYNQNKKLFLKTKISNKKINVNTNFKWEKILND